MPNTSEGKYISHGSSRFNSCSLTSVTSSPSQGSGSPLRGRSGYSSGPSIPLGRRPRPPAEDSVRTPGQETDLRRGKPQRLFYLFTENLPQPSERSPSTQHPPLIPTSLRPATRSLRPICPAHGEERGVETGWRGVAGGLQSDQE